LGSDFRFSIRLYGPNNYACILIGAGARIDSDEFLLFEKLINVVHKVAPGANLCFNTGPTDSIDAIKRWCWKNKGRARRPPRRGTFFVSDTGDSCHKLTFRYHGGFNAKLVNAASS